MKTINARVGFVATRLAGKDGVSLEVEKWVQVLQSMGAECFFFAGESTWPDERTLLVPEAHFRDPEVLSISADLFDDNTRTPATSHRIHLLKTHLKQKLYEFRQRFDLDVIVSENVLSIPMHVPLGLAIAEFVAETTMPTIGHHHDFTWERQRFIVNAAEDYLNAAFPPPIRAINHVVINSHAQRQLALRRGLSSTIVPNVMNFEQLPPPRDGITAKVRERLEITTGEYMLLQPTRIVPRKRIERAIELTKRLKLPCTLVISHEWGDEGMEYVEYLRHIIDLYAVPVRFASDCFGLQRTTEGDEITRFSLADAYLAADLVTYPSAIEGFGNAFLEAIYYRRPLVVSTYDIFRLDIAPKGFRVIEFADLITDSTVRETRELLLNPALSAAMTEHNYQLGRKHYAFANLERSLTALLTQCLGT